MERRRRKAEVKSRLDKHQQVGVKGGEVLWYCGVVGGEVVRFVLWYYFIIYEGRV